MQIQWQVIVPVKVISPNQYEHWTHRAKRNKLIRRWIWAMWTKDKPKIDLPCTVKLTRIATRFLDSQDNLRFSLKGTLDVICDFILPGLPPGQADSDTRLSFEYDQRKPATKEQPAIEITIYQNHTAEAQASETPAAETQTGRPSE